MSRRRLAGTLVGLAALALAADAGAQSRTYVAPHWDNTPGDVTVAFGGRTYVNHGLVAVGWLPAATRDFNGETLGSFSSMALSNWKKAADGSYTGTLRTLPDRGPNNVGPFKSTTDYANRVHEHAIKLVPGKGLTITPTGGFLLKDQTGQPFTGMDPGANVVERGGVRYPSPAGGEGAGKLSLDSEAIAYLPDGSFYVSDEYAAGVYLFDRTGTLTGAIQTVPALLPIKKGQLNFGAEKAPEQGRRNNQGLEALTISPDGKRLIAVLQSATVQDSASNNATRNNTRVLVYDISKTRLPKAPIGHYALQLPTVRENGDGQAADVTAAQSEAVALSEDRLLVLARDGNGRGKGAPNAPVYKSILLVDLAGATNLAGTPYEQGGQPIARDGALNPDIKPAAQAELVDILNPVQLARFGINLSVSPSTPTSLPEKIEAMAIGSTFDKTGDVFLLVGSDNDFATARGHVNGQDFDASLHGDTGTGDNDNLVLVYRLSLPK
ncbi:esterase-like activity of phytase family protein [Caulobacter sp. 602-1]|uniref:esterase-like activity of phytase family protein n=1 Tax=Caulobacter sp. 602-1 TaxID=2492472 RepID=UPI000F6345CF|nr:esterase-like activity of phytase family protein [Caulobacter sp. 602-1]RRN63298.1 esterase-like activity of phytase family protein [Caulobacter sp. 602-1]